jgi:hypothetical protein
MIGETYSGVEAPSQFESWLAGAQTERIVDLIRDFSIETVPISAPKITSMGVHLERGSDVYVGWPPSRSIGAVIETAARLSRWGYRPVPHIAARSIATRDDLAQALRRLSAEAGVDQVLLVGGRAAASSRSASSIAPCRSWKPGCSKSSGSGASASPATPQATRRSGAAISSRPYARSSPTGGAPASTCISPPSSASTPMRW